MNIRETCFAASLSISEPHTATLTKNIAIAVSTFENSRNFRRKHKGTATVIPIHCCLMPANVCPRLRPTPGKEEDDGSDGD
jgi:hypothetical protein